MRSACNYLIENANLVLEDRVIPNGALLTEGERILQIGVTGEISCPQNAVRVDAEGLYVGPGFVDIHVHGGGGAEFFEEPLKAAEFFLRHGTTTILPTSKNEFDLPFCLEGYDRIRRARQDSGVGRAIAGVYMEGPFMNPKYGANPEQNLWRGDIDPKRYVPLVDGAGDLVKIWAVAPERPGLEPFLNYVKQVNPKAIFAVGHSEATPAQIGELAHYGMKVLTHCMDATGRLPLWEGTRGSGPDEYCFLDDGMYAELISDSGAVHVSATLQKIILKIKGVDRVILITDSNAVDDPAPAGLEQYDDLSFDPMGRLAGSKLTMDKACRNIMTHTGVGIREAFLMAARNPARAIGLEAEVGTLAPGKKANLIFVDEDFCVKKVMLEGAFQ